jgi:hypothetical protein
LLLFNIIHMQYVHVCIIASQTCYGCVETVTEYKIFWHEQWASNIHSLQKWGGQPLEKHSPDTTENMVCNLKSIGFVAVCNFLVLSRTRYWHRRTLRSLRGTFSS